MRSDLPTRFWSKVAVAGSDECWTWKAATTSGYGVFFISKKRRTVPAHRVAYQLLKGPIPEGLVLDHLCRNRACVNPIHLEPVTHRENCLRGVSSTAENAKKTHCKNGHELNEANTYVQTTYEFPRRLCRPCRREIQRNYDRRRREQHYQHQTGATPSAVTR